MNKKILFSVIGILSILIAALSYILLTPKEGSNNPHEVEASKNTASNEPAVDNTPSSPGVYVAYSQDAVASTKGTKLLFFHAPWCPQCRAMEASIKEDGLPPGVTVFKVDYDSNQPLRQQYGVTIQTTFVKIDDAGNKLGSYVAYDEPQFSSVQRELLP